MSILSRTLPNYPTNLPDPLILPKLRPCCKMELLHFTQPWQGALAIEGDVFDELQIGGRDGREDGTPLSNLMDFEKKPQSSRHIASSGWRT